ncbi:MAG: hypothetical protein GOU98_04490 [Candidatus Altiarchaeota archaeon]|nr:hypothetical protein [Candidatus Altiarchaeota archaeon]
MREIYSSNQKKYGAALVQGVEYSPQEFSSNDFKRSSQVYDSKLEINKRLVLQDMDPKNDNIFNENEREFEMPLESMGQTITPTPLNSDLKALENKWYRRFVKALE